MKFLVRRARLFSFVALCVLNLVPAGQAQEVAPAEEAKTHFERAAHDYQLGRFEEAIGEFEEAYKLAPEPILLFNIAQANRRLGRKERALFLYRRYLEQAPATASNRADAARHVSELVEEMRRDEEARRSALAREAAQERARATSATNENEARELERRAALRPWTLVAAAGPAFLAFGNDAVEAPVALAFSLEGARTWQLSELSLQVGLHTVGLPLSFTRLDGVSQGRSWMFGGLVSTGLLVPVAGRWMLGGELGLGVIWWGGLGKGNPFTAMGRAATAPVPLPSGQVRLDVRCGLGERLFLLAGPRLTLSKTLSEGLTDDVPFVLRWQVELGLGVAL